MYKLSILTILFLLLPLTGLSSQTSYLDSLEQAIAKTNGEHKLELILDLVNYYSIGEKVMDVSDFMEEEARKQGNMRYVAASKAIKAKYFSICNITDSTIYYAEQANRIYEKYQIRNPNQTYYYIGKVYVHNGLYELGIYNLKKYLEAQKNYLSYKTLAEAYFAAKKYNLAKQTLLQSIELFELDAKANPTVNQMVLYDLLAMTNVYSDLYDEALDACATMESLLEQNQNELHDDAVTRYRFHIYNIYASIYIRSGDFSNAEKYLNKAKGIPSDALFEDIKNEMNSTLGEYYLAIGDYGKALKNFEIAAEYFSKQTIYQSLALEVTDLKIKALKGLGKYDDALDLQLKVSHYKDSIYQANAPLQILQMSKEYEKEQFLLREAKGKAESEKKSVLILGLFLVVILLLVILYIVYANNRAQKKKNQILFKRYAEIDKYTGLLENTSSVREDKENSLGHNDILFEKIEFYIKNEEAYKKSNLSREDVARELNTNWLYVVESIKKNTGLTFLDYVNYIRLDYARKKLVSDPLIAVNSIIFEAGFSSTSAFYRLFKAEFGMSPNELRQLQAEQNAENKEDANPSV